jgi:hypothetical protein
MIHPKKFKKMLVKQQVAKTAQDIFIGIRFVGSSSQKAHMMAYDMQLKDFTRCTRRRQSSRRYED